MADHSIRRKRSVSSNEDQSELTQADGGCQAISETEWKNSEELTRTTRNVESGSVYHINESFVKVLVVADKSMVKFHTHLSDYILTLMAHVSNWLFLRMLTGCLKKLTVFERAQENFPRDWEGKTTEYAVQENFLFSWGTLKLYI